MRNRIESRIPVAANRLKMQLNQKYPSPAHGDRRKIPEAYRGIIYPFLNSFRASKPVKKAFSACKAMEDAMYNSGCSKPVR
jgi:hypothetical protein